MAWIDINHVIRHVRQPREGLCWQATVAMLRHRSLEWVVEQARRHNIATNGNLSVEHAQRLGEAMGLRAEGMWGLHPSLTVTSLARLLPRSPVMVLGEIYQAAGMAARMHAIVVSGMQGNTEEGPERMFVIVHDPGWPAGDRVYLSVLNTQTISRVDMLYLRH
jgi:hypothetical protein